MMDVDNGMAVNGFPHENGVHEQLSNHDGEGFSSVIVAGIPGCHSETEDVPRDSDTRLDENGMLESVAEEIVDRKDAKKTSVVSSRSIVEKKNVPLKDQQVSDNTSKRTTNRVEGHLSKHGKSGSLLSTANVEPSEGIKSSTTGDEKPPRVGTLPAYGFSFKCNERAEKRKEFYSKLEEKIHAKEAEKSTLQAKTKENQEAEIRMFRKSLTFKATPIPSFYRAPAPPKTELKKIPTTRAKSPKLGRKKGSLSARGSEANGGSDLQPVRLSLDEKRSQNKPTAEGICLVPVKNPMRKSLPRLPSEKTKLPSKPNHRKELATGEITKPSNEQGSQQTTVTGKNRDDSPHVHEADSRTEPVLDPKST